MLSLLRTRRPIIAPSMLKCDFGNLRRELELLEAADCSLIHLDVMDGHFVPNLSYGPMVIERLRSATALRFDAHLMVSEPGRYLMDYVGAGCDAITFHIEAVSDPVALLGEIRRQDVVAGVAINPETPFARVASVLSECDMLLVMSVRPGFGGQKFMPEVLPRVLEARAVQGDSLIISIDGGVSCDTIEACAQAGADVFVAGSAIFDAVDYSAAVAELREIASLSRLGC